MIGTYLLSSFCYVRFSYFIIKMTPSPYYFFIFILFNFVIFVRKNRFKIHFLCIYSSFKDIRTERRQVFNWYIGLIGFLMISFKVPRGRTTTTAIATKQQQPASLPQKIKHSHIIQRIQFI